MNNITIRAVHEAQCNLCGQIKRSSHHAVVEGWAEDHKCTGPSYNVFDDNEAAYTGG